MKNESNYKLRKRIKELEREINLIRSYKTEMINIYETLISVTEKGSTSVSVSYLLRKFRYLVK